ncbi:MAG: hypothetical protein WC516_03725 [Patescibacteria group bacterium]
MSEITQEIEWLLETYNKDYSHPIPKDISKIKLSQLVSKLGFFYEKLRNAIDYNEEHLIRRNSLKRLLKRQIMFLQERDVAKISQTLIYEFIRAKYLPNDTLPETVIDEVAAILAKYLLLLRYFWSHPSPLNGKLIEWTLDIAVCELDEFFLPQEKELAMVNYMYSEMVKTIAFTKVKIDEKEKNLQIYIAVLKNLSKADLPLLRYRLLKLYLPNWTSLSAEEINDFCANSLNVKQKIDRHLSHPLAFQISQIVRIQSVFFGILKQLIEQNQSDAHEIIDQPEELEVKIATICSNNYKNIRARLMGSIFRVIIYIFFTKTVLAFVLELPYDRLIIGAINWQSLIINVVFHPVLMAFIASSIRVPGEKNTKIIIGEIKKIVYGEDRKIVFKPRKMMRRGSIGYLAFNAFYSVMFIISFGIVIWALRQIHFNLLSGLLFVFFLTVVSFFGFRLRTFANQYLVIPRKDNLINLAVDFFTLPIIRVGRFFSSNFSRINVFLYILDFIIETPFKMLVEALEKAVSFIREKREEIDE